MLRKSVRLGVVFDSVYNHVIVINMFISLYNTKKKIEVRLY
jgi:hypothetical protein